MHRRHPQHALFQVDPQRRQRPDRIEIPGPAGDAVASQLFGHRLGGAVQFHRHRRRPLVGRPWPQQPQVIAPRQIVQQGLDHRNFLHPHQVMHPPVPRRRVAADPVPRGQSVDVIRHPGTGRDLGMVRPGGGVPLVQHAVVEEMRLPRQLEAERLAQDHDPLMRAIGLVGREQIDVTPKGRDIRKPVWRVADPVHHRPRARVPRHRADRRHVVDLGDDVGAMRETDQLDPPVRQQGRQRRRLQRPGLAVHLPFTHFDPGVRQPPPHARIRLVVLVRHHHSATRARQPGPRGLRQHIGVRTGGRPERHFLARDAHHRRQPGPCLVHLGPARLRPRIGPIGLHLAVAVEPGQPVHHLHARVASARIFKEGVRRQHRRLKRRELRTDKV